MGYFIRKHYRIGFDGGELLILTINLDLSLEIILLMISLQVKFLLKNSREKYLSCKLLKF